VQRSSTFWTPLVGSACSPIKWDYSLLEHRQFWVSTRPDIFSNL